ncbi:hypothetical protein [Priestia aryabhattai]|nr:hypothetical protein [Priestia aryabhattai]
MKGSFFLLAADLQSIHKVLSFGLTHITQSPEDVKSLVETWV